MLHAGGKFGGGGYAVSGGLHGVGVSVVNALSSKVAVEVRTDGYRWTQDYKLGVPTAPLAQHEATDETGTSVTFWADPDVFETTEYSFETLSRRFQEMAFLNKGLTIKLTDERELAKATAGADEAGADEKDDVKTVTYHYEGGIVDYVTYLNSRKGTWCTRPSSTWRRRTRTRACPLRSRCSGTAVTARVCTPSPTSSTRMRAAPTKRASGPR